MAILRVDSLSADWDSQPYHRALACAAFEDWQFACSPLDNWAYLAPEFNYSRLISGPLALRDCLPPFPMPALTHSPLKNLAVSERPQERLQRLGPSALSDSELIAMILRSGSKGTNVLNVASSLVNRAGSLSGMISWTDSEFMRIKGIGKVKSLQLLVVIEICRRILAADAEALPVLDKPERVYKFMRSRVIGLEVEKFWTLSLNRKNRLLQLHEATSGTASNSLAHPREVFREAIRCGASSLICVHNHPSGDPSPSAADIRVTRQLKEASNIVGIPLLDHVIAGNVAGDPSGLGWYSFQESGLI